MTKKEFALSAIRPYYLDPSTCGYEGNSCVYLTTDGRMCILGKHMIDPGNWTKQDTAFNIFKSYLQKDVLKPKFVDILSREEWGSLQFLHDTIARDGDNSHEQDIQNACVALDLFTYEELIAP